MGREAIWLRVYWNKITGMKLIAPLKLLLDNQGAIALVKSGAYPHTKHIDFQ